MCKKNIMDIEIYKIDHFNLGIHFMMRHKIKNVNIKIETLIT